MLIFAPGGPVSRIWVYPPKGVCGSQQVGLSGSRQACASLQKP